MVQKRTIGSKNKQIPMQVWQMGKVPMHTKERTEISTISTTAAKRERRAMIKKEEEEEEEEGGYWEEEDTDLT